MIRRVVCALMLLALAVPPARAGVPIPWAPANTGVMWYQSGDPSYPLGLPRQPPGDATGAWWLTRRIAASPHVPGLMHLGSFFNGLYGSAGGGAWAPVSPGCWLPPDPPSAIPTANGDSYRVARRALVALNGLDACGIEGIAYDPEDRTRMYVAAYDVTSMKGTEPTIGDGGVYRSDDAGVSWTRLAGGFRGNGLAVARASANAPATIISGFIQASNGGVGVTPNNGSLQVSTDDGRSWTSVVLPASNCSDAPATSQRITPTVEFDPLNQNRVLAGTNAGLYASEDGGKTWRLVRLACGGVWGIVFSGSRVFIGDKDGIISSAPTSTLAFSPVIDLGAGKIQSLIADPRDPSSLYAALWSGGDAGVFRVPTSGGSPVRFDDSLLREAIPADQEWPPGLPKPFPLAFRDGKSAPAPSLFLAMPPATATRVTAPLYVSTIFRGVFVRGD